MHNKIAMVHTIAFFMLKIFKDNRFNIDRKILPRRLTLSIKDKKLRKEIKIAEVSLDLFREKGI